MMAAMTLAGGLLVVTAAAAAAPSSGTTSTGTTTPNRTAGATTATSTTATAASSRSTTDMPTANPSPGQVQVANKVASPFVTMAGSQENAVALATALRTGTTANLTFTSTSPTGETTQTAIELANPTKPMGWGNVSHALALAQLSLRQAGIDNPTATDLQAALNGGTATTADGKTATFAGVLQQRAGGMGWGQIAKTYGTTMGAVNRGLKAPATTVASSASASVGTTATAKRTVAAGTTNGRGANGITTTSGLNANATAPSHGSKGITTGTGTVSNNGAGGHAGKGIMTASGSTAGGSSRVFSAAGHGQGNAIGRGVVTATGGSGSNPAAGTRGGTSGIVTGSGAAATAMTTAQPGGGMGKSGGHGNGKGGGG
jgi:hypothetical protein